MKYLSAHILNPGYGLSESIAYEYSLSYNTHMMKPEDLKYTIAGLKGAYDQFFYDDYVFFWKHDEKKGRITEACLSQRYPSTFHVDGIIYNCAEQFMMAEKARIFGDNDIRAKILAVAQDNGFTSFAEA